MQMKLTKEQEQTLYITSCLDHFGDLTMLHGQAALNGDIDIMTLCFMKLSVEYLDALSDLMPNAEAKAELAMQVVELRQTLEDLVDEYERNMR